MDIRSAIMAATGVVASLLLLGREVSAQETPSAVIDRAVAAYGAAAAAADSVKSVSTGTITLFSIDGPKSTHPVMVVRHRSSEVQRVIKQDGGELRQGSDGVRTWSSLNGEFFTAAEGEVLDFIHSQTIRSVPVLLSRVLALRSLSRSGRSILIEAEDQDRRRTKYFFDDDRFLVTRLEFNTGSATDIAGRQVSNVEAYVFSDFRSIDDRMTAFKIERFFNGIKTEEMRFDSVSYNVSLSGEEFRP